MKRLEKHCKIFLKWFKLGFEQNIYYLDHPNRWLDIRKSFEITYKYHVTFNELLPWNRKWLYKGYYNGYYNVDTFNFTIPNDNVIKSIYYMIVS